ncbi:hypothetical protein GQ602_005857 [Ophiocordyceps camponoti-floridani]|uniref:Uncharacterized protein n=1 Tax=Ophiocordyceps camponoti-floridani TaxID=2030778 RepID=A0A8H4VC72_9HYPO|nr:hypothetical protein GQ602_005857 [Ophiocordyceps camponoti-floridani]
MKTILFALSALAATSLAAPTGQSGTFPRPQDGLNLDKSADETPLSRDVSSEPGSRLEKRALVFGHQFIDTGNHRDIESPVRAFRPGQRS